MGSAAGGSPYLSASFSAVSAAPLKISARVARQVPNRFRSGTCSSERLLLFFFFFGLHLDRISSCHPLGEKKATQPLHCLFFSCFADASTVLPSETLTTTPANSRLLLPTKSTAVVISPIQWFFFEIFRTSCPCGFSLLHISVILPPRITCNLH